MADTRRRPRAAVLIPILGAAAIVAIQIWESQPWRGNTPSLWDPASLIMMGFTVLPHVPIALGLVLGRANGWVWWPTLIYGVLAGAGGVWMGISIVTSDSSTAVLGFLFLPLYQFFSMLPAATIIGLINSRHRRQDSQTTQPG